MNYMTIRLDMEIEVPDSAPEDVKQNYRRCLATGAWFDDEYTCDRAGYTSYRYSYKHEFEMRGVHKDECHSQLSHKHREALKAMVIESGVRDVHLRDLWRLIGKMVPVQVFWTVVSGDRREDVSEEIGQEEYNSIMLSPLEQLGAVI